MKPKPSSRMHVATASGPSSIRTPSASSTSAEPHWLVAERLPCLAILAPAPAAISAAVVDTLKVGAPPPVPAVSTRPSPASTCTASVRIVHASPAISATVSPFVRSADHEGAGLGLGGAALHHLVQHLRGLRRRTGPRHLPRGRSPL